MKIETAEKTPEAVRVEDMALAADDREIADDYVFLIGRPTLDQFLDFVIDHSDPSDANERPDERELIDEWKRASECVRKLEEEERGWADNPEIRSLDPRLHHLRDALFADPLFSRTIRAVPADIGVVELDRLVVYQKHINLDFTRTLRDRLPPSPSDEEIFRFCLPFDHPRPPVTWKRLNRSNVAFYSPSNDLRYLGMMFLRPENIVDQPPRGDIVGVVGLAVGFGSNFFNVIHVENRLVVHNGSHRAFTLRSHGITHAPCIIKHVSSREELAVVASSDLRRNPDRYLRHPRPSVLKDYFDPRLKKVLPIKRRLRQLRISYGVEEVDIPSM